MRFYRKKQYEMLQGMANFLDKEQNKLAEKVPALRNFIPAFSKKQEELRKLYRWNPHLVDIEKRNKASVKDELVKAVMKLLAAIKAANYEGRSRQLNELQFTAWDLKKLPAQKLSETSLKIIRAAKKLKNLRYYGLAPQDIGDALFCYKEFTGVKNAPKQKQKKVTRRNKQLDEGVKEAVAMLKEAIDPLMAIALEDDPELAMVYKEKRKVLQLFGRPTDAEVRYRKSRKRKKKKE